jgi:alkanesulfonate monooxygenase SsuD/methylene tetrahydromethanopterin reductase-like flavin-dependent oxidoreductase (luciferase family)
MYTNFFESLLSAVSASMQETHMLAAVQLGITLPLAGDFDLTHADMAEALGYDAIWVSEHIAFHVPTFDAVTTMAALAARTSRIRIGSAILLLPLRPPAAVAKAVSTLEACIAKIQAYIDAGAHEVILVPTTSGVADFAQQLQRLAHEVVPHFRA